MSKSSSGGLLPVSELLPADLPAEPPREPRSPGRDDPLLSASSADPSLAANPYAEAVRALPIKTLLGNPRALKHLAHAADRADETAAGDAAHGHGNPQGVAHELKMPSSDLHK